MLKHLSNSDLTRSNCSLEECPHGYPSRYASAYDILRVVRPILNQYKTFSEENIQL